MFDYHMHSTVSFDGNDSALDMALTAKAAGLKEICFTDHIDYTPQMNMVFDTNVYNEAYDRLEVPGLLIRRGMEFGLTPTNRAQLETDAKRRSFDFILGSVHFVDDKDIYLDEYWEGKTMEQAVDLFLQETLADADPKVMDEIVAEFESDPPKWLVIYYNREFGPPYDARVAEIFETKYEFIDSRGTYQLKKLKEAP